MSDHLMISVSTDHLRSLVDQGLAAIVAKKYRREAQIERLELQAEASSSAPDRFRNPTRELFEEKLQLEVINRNHAAFMWLRAAIVDEHLEHAYDVSLRDIQMLSLGQIETIHLREVQ